MKQTVLGNQHTIAFLCKLMCDFLHNLSVCSRTARSYPVLQPSWPLLRDDFTGGAPPVAQRER